MSCRLIQRVGTSMLILLGERSQQNSYFKHIIALYLYATGASRQAISVTAHLGVGSSYATIAAEGDKARGSQFVISESTSKHATDLEGSHDTNNDTSPLATSLGSEPLQSEAQSIAVASDDNSDSGAESGDASSSDIDAEVLAGPKKSRNDFWEAEDTDSESEEESLFSKVCRVPCTR